MKTSYEILAQEVLPSLRALIAKKLTTSHSLSQTEAADRMGLSQPAISQYLKNLRGFKTSVITTHPTLSRELEKLTLQIAAREISVEQQLEEMEKFCQMVVNLGMLGEFY